MRWRPQVTAQPLHNLCARCASQVAWAVRDDAGLSCTLARSRLARGLRSCWWPATPLRTALGCRICAVRARAARAHNNYLQWSWGSALRCARAPGAPRKAAFGGGAGRVRESCSCVLLLLTRESCSCVLLLLTRESCSCVLCCSPGTRALVLLLLTRESCSCVLLLLTRESCSCVLLLRESCFCVCAQEHDEGGRSRWRDPQVTRGGGGGSEVTRERGSEVMREGRRE
jgi:hypothetical protein